MTYAGYLFLYLLLLALYAVFVLFFGVKIAFIIFVKSIKKRGGLKK
jgi:hypothetical protein